LPLYSGAVRLGGPTAEVLNEETRHRWYYSVAMGLETAGCISRFSFAGVSARLDEPEGDL
jgi:hypothetical protein